MDTIRDAVSSMSPTAFTLYKHLLDTLGGIGPVEVEVKKTSVHLRPMDGTVAKSAMAGVSPRRSCIRLTIVSEAAIVSPRIAKAEQTSRRRWHNEIILSDASEIDTELSAWLAQAHGLQIQS